MSFPFSGIHNRSTRRWLVGAMSLAVVTACASGCGSRSGTTSILPLTAGKAFSSGRVDALQSTTGPRETTLYHFLGGTDGQNPQAGVIMDSQGALYGTTSLGGTIGLGIGGTVFKLTPSGSGYTERVLYRFQGGNNGDNPLGGLIADANGALYGTTFSGGQLGGGTVFKLTPSGAGYAMSVLHAFGGQNDGISPRGTLIVDANGSLYGTTYEGGDVRAGTVYKLTPSGSGYSESVLYRFRGGNDGAWPFAGLVADAQGALYGTTVGGGNGCCGGDGTVFKLTPSRSGYTESVLYRFRSGTADGGYPHGALIVDAKGALYGTTSTGDGFGTAFKLTPAGSGYSESILHRFQGGSDGAGPQAGLFADAKGALYGTTSGGGKGFVGCVFKLTPSGGGYTETILHHFPGGNDGQFPAANLIADTKGTLYGTTLGGGVRGFGTVFRLIP